MKTLFQIIFIVGTAYRKKFAVGNSRVIMLIKSKFDQVTATLRTETMIRRA